MPTKKQGFYIRAENIQQIVREHYEPGRQDRCLKWVWRRHVHPVYGIGYRAFLNVLKAKIPPQKTGPEDLRQLSLFDETPAM